MISQFQYIYGPVHSWRLGKSLGVDPLASRQKICNMNCSYCQLGQTADISLQRREYVPVDKVMEEINSLPDFFIDYITFSGRGEPTLAKNLGDMIREVKRIRREKVAVITNSLLLPYKDVRDDLLSADFVLVKLDAANQEMLSCINGVDRIDYDQLIKGISKFREEFKGKFALQIMLLSDNFEHLKQLGNLAFFLNPHEVQLNTPLRACGQQPLGPSRLEKAKEYFRGVPVISCYDVPSEVIEPMDRKATTKRHGIDRKSRYVY